MVLKEIIEILEKHFPQRIAEGWDNVGHILGYKDDIINKVQISLDLTDNVVREAVENGVDLIITHHPPIFKAIDRINDSSILGKKLLKLIRHGVNVYAIHTNLDAAKEGLNQYVAEMLQGKNIKIMDEIKESLYKIELFVSDEEVFSSDDKEKVLSFSSSKVVLNGEIKAFRIDCTGRREVLNQIENRLSSKGRLIKSNLLRLESKISNKEGIGRIFRVEGDYDLESYSDKIKEIFALDHVRLIKSNNSKVKKAVVVNGSGASYWKKALRMGADVLITGDVKYHDALDAYEAGINIIDMGHYESEHFFNELIIKKLNDKVEVKVYNEKRIFKVR